MYTSPLGKPVYSRDYAAFELLARCLLAARGELETGGANVHGTNAQCARVGSDVMPARPRPLYLFILDDKYLDNSHLEWRSRGVTELLLWYKHSLPKAAQEVLCGNFEFEALALLSVLKPYF
jgi:hypothetical protein